MKQFKQIGLDSFLIKEISYLDLNTALIASNGSASDAETMRAKAATRLAFAH